MLNTYKLIAGFLFFFLILFNKLPAQQTAQDRLDAFSARLIVAIRNQSRPQAFLTTDKSIFKTGESIWFNTLILNSVSQKVSTKSKYVFVDVVNDQDSVFASVLLDAAKQQLSSKISIPDAVPTGPYWLRAYTMQMILNDSDYCAVKPIYIFNNGPDANNKISRPKNKSSVTADRPIVTFFPEGGSVITGASSVIAFSIVNNTGKPVSIEGVIKDNRDSIITKLIADKNGLGKFEYEPARVRQYIAFISWKGKEISYPLPAYNFKTGRISIAANNNGNRLVRVLLEDSIYSNSFLSYVIGISKDSLCFASIGKGQYEFNLPGQKLPPGITTLYLLDSNFNMLSERSIYNKENNLVVTASVNKNNIKPNNPVTLNVSIANKENKPIIAAYNVGVTDSVFIEPSGTCAMTDPVYNRKEELFNNYSLARLSCLADEQLDVLMLLNNKTFSNIQAMQPDQQLASGTDSLLDISGIALNDKSQPAINTIVTLLSNSGNGLFVTDTTDSKGRFYFAVDGYMDSTQFSLNTKTSGGKKQQVKFIVNPLKWTVFKTPSHFKQHFVPETSLRKYRSDYLDPEPDASIKKLPLVQLRGKANYDESKRVSKYSAVITSDEIPEGGNVGNAVLGVGGLHLSQGYLIAGGPSSMRGPAARDEPLILVNGSQAPLGAGSGLGDASPALSFLSTLNAKEIDFIEILKGTDAANYGVRGGNGVILINMSVNRKDNIGTAAGTTVFYARGISGSPAFPVINSNTKSLATVTSFDNRSTIFWEGGVLTNTPEPKTFTFSTSNIPATYKITVSGITSRGDVIYKTLTFKSK